MKFKDLLEQKNIRQIDLANKLGIQRAVVNHWCHDRYAPTINQVVKLSKILNVPIKTIVLMFYKEGI